MKGHVLFPKEADWLLARVSSRISGTRKSALMLLRRGENNKQVLLQLIKCSEASISPRDISSARQYGKSFNMKRTFQNYLKSIIYQCILS